MSLEIEDLIIPWSELVLKEKIGAGVFPPEFCTYQLYLGFYSPLLQYNNMHFSIALCLLF